MLDTFNHLNINKNERVYNRNKIIESGVKVTNEDMEQKTDKQHPELEGTKNCNLYLDNNTAYNKHIETIKLRNNVRLIFGEIIKNGIKFD